MPRPLTMQEMFMQYPIGTKICDAEVIGYRQIKTESALLLSNGQWQNTAEHE